MRMRYWTDRGWQDSFDSLAAGALPGAVEVALWFGAPDGGGVGGTGEESGARDAAEELGVPDRVRTISVPDAMGAGAVSARPAAEALP
jgi:hypothetical protein